MVNAEKTKYMVVSCEQIAEQNCNIKDRKWILWNGGTVQIFGNNCNKWKVQLGRN
jgi:hypothetical protein